MSSDPLIVKMQGRDAGVLRKEGDTSYSFAYFTGYDGPPVSLTMPVRDRAYRFDRFPPFFDGLLPEGWQLEALLRQAKLDRHDYMRQLAIVGGDTVGAVTVFAESADG